MEQQVNLYRKNSVDDSYSAREKLSLVQFFLLCVMFNGLLFGVHYFFDKHAFYQTGKEQLSFTANNNAVKTAVVIEDIVSNTPVNKTDIKRLQNTIINKQTINALYEKHIKTQPTSFYNVLYSIHEHLQNDITIDAITINNYGREVMLKGFAANQQTVPGFLKTLNQRTVFSNTYFGLLSIKRLDNASGYRFEMKKPYAHKN